MARRKAKTAWVRPDTAGVRLTVDVRDRLGTLAVAQGLTVSRTVGVLLTLAEREPDAVAEAAQAARLEQASVRVQASVRGAAR